MRAQLESHLEDINRTADVAYDKTKPNDAIDLVVVTDSEAILGIGDQGVGGITISTSKCEPTGRGPFLPWARAHQNKAALYTLGAGINPNRILPVVLDVGTDNHSLFADKLYMGWKRTRLRGKHYDQFVDKFLRSCRELFPSSIIHFEDVSLLDL